jgi:hypothetical protein
MVSKTPRYVPGHPRLFDAAARQAVDAGTGPAMRMAAVI